MSKVYDLVFIGSGNVASHLSFHFQAAGHRILQIVSKNIANAERLGNVYGADYTNNLEDLTRKGEIYIVAVNDDAIKEVCESIELPEGAILCYTSGSIQRSDIESGLSQFANFYPLQTFKKDIDVNIFEVPFFISTENTECFNTLFELASSVSNHVYHLKEKDRARLHLAAVFANNFSNHMYASAYQLLEGTDLKFEFLLPLIKQGVKTLSKEDPSILQTGPAKRGDLGIIKKQMEMLKDRPDLQEIYEVISKSIQNHHET